MIKALSLLVFLFLLVFLWIGMACVFVHLDRKEFNHGICKRCGKPLRHFDNDSHGGQGWCCDTCGYPIWISWIDGDKELAKGGPT